ncbi:unnamed protein product [Caenorhabditis auriculariae]|uniref:Uncharacterized protein n=1 Tax=Caenorhabditis auriculariae TaxID=2777116 RepID=A0A8S1HPT5_9PELO|nr:unnamed protein product [Caenorhabditis auriculariae]
MLRYFQVQKQLFVKSSERGATSKAQNSLFEEIRRGEVAKTKFAPPKRRSKMQNVFVLVLVVLCATVAFAQYQQQPNYNAGYQTTRGYNTNQQYPYNSNNNPNQQYGQQYGTTTPNYNSQYGGYSTTSSRQFDQQFFNSVSKASALLAVVGAALAAF